MKTEKDTFDFLKFLSFDARKNKIKKDKLTWTGSYRFDRTSQHLTVPSMDPLITTDESSLNFTALTVPAWPENKIKNYFKSEFFVIPINRSI